MDEWHRFARSVGYAYAGIVHTIKTQPNMRIHVVAAILVLFCTWWLAIPRGDVLLVLFAIVLVWSLELLNTAVEVVIDLVTSEWHPQAKIAKDAAAGAVLVAAIFSVVIGIAVFFEPLVAKLTILFW